MNNLEMIEDRHTVTMEGYKNCIAGFRLVRILMTLKCCRVTHAMQLYQSLIMSASRGSEGSQTILSVIISGNWKDNIGLIKLMKYSWASLQL